jgi:hypothetical protein
MSNVRHLLETLSLDVKPEGSQLRVNCPACADDQKKHLYIRPDTGVGYCQKCSWSPNPYKLIEKITSKIPAEIFKMLDNFDLNDSKGQLPATSSQRSAEKGEEKKIALDKEDIRVLNEEENREFCRIKRIDPFAFEKFRPFAHKTKPWVLLPAFSPESPKACGWLRCRLDGEPIDLGGGNLVKYPIVKGSTHGLFGLEWLTQENPDTIIFCEAWRDALAAISIDLHATASSGGASKWDDDWLELFAGKKVYICMDADKAGQKATLRAASKIATVATEVFIVTLPYDVTNSGGKDLHDYIVADGHGKDFLLLLSQAEKYRANCQQETIIILPNGYPMSIAEKFYKELTDKKQIWRYYNHMQAWCIYNGKVYEITEPADTKARVWRFTSKCLRTAKKGPPVDLNVTDNSVKNTLSAMASFNGVEMKPSITAPAWLRQGETAVAEYVLAVNNGLLDVSGDQAKLIKHTPDFLNFNILGYDYDPDAECPNWFKFLEEVFEVEGLPDTEKMVSLQEWFGLLLTSETKYHKMLGIIGPKRSGKSTIARILTALIGA